MKNTNNFDFILLGNGASSALVLIELKKKNLLDSSSILIIEPFKDSNKNKNFCFWASPSDTIVQDLNHLIEHTWSEIEINQNKAEELDPLRYYHISHRRIQSHIEEITVSENIQFIYPEVSEITIDSLGEFIQIGEERYYSSNILDSRTPTFQNSELNETLIFQSFIGWVVKLKKEIVNANSFKMMDFNIGQNDSTQFIYILPLDNSTALVEVTRFGENTITKVEADQILNEYVTTHLGEFETIEIEQGCIPMSNCNIDFQKNNSLTQLGARNYCVKPSTGYALKTMHSQASNIVQLFEQNKPTRLNNIDHKKATSGRFAFYDSLLLIILLKWPSHGRKIFTQLFANVDTQTILSFLDEKTNIYEEINIFRKLPITIFLKALSIRILSGPHFRTISLLLLTITLIALTPFPQIQSGIGYGLLTIGMVLVGIPHGAVDHLISSKGLSSKITPRFVFSYLGLMTIMGILWFYLPNITLVGFLLFSAFHFGQADIKSWKLSQNLSMVWGISVLVYILGTHQHETNEILSSITSISLPFEISPLLIAPWLVYAIVKKRLNMVFTILWIVFTSQLPLLLAFGIYFIGQHSITSWNQLTDYLNIEKKTIWIQSLPFQIGAWIILALFLFIENTTFQLNISGIFNTSNSWGIFFIFISCISMPHAFYMSAIYLQPHEQSQK
jgi:lycopene beta-cyclase